MFDMCPPSARSSHPCYVGRTPTLLDRLRDEWRTLSVRRAALARVGAWGLPGGAIDSLDDVLRRAGYREDGWHAGCHAAADEDGYLIALLTVARHDPLAARIVLQRIAPALGAFARQRRESWPARQELLDELVANAWSRIRSYPVERRPQRVASNLVRDIGHATTVQPRRRKDSSELVTAPHLLTDAAEERLAEPLDELVDVLDTARERGLGAEDIRLMCLLASMPRAIDVAATLDVTPRTIRNRRNAVIHRLRRLVEEAA